MGAPPSLNKMNGKSLVDMRRAESICPIIGLTVIDPIGPPFISCVDLEGEMTYSRSHRNEERDAKMIPCRQEDFNLPRQILNLSL